MAKFGSKEDVRHVEVKGHKRRHPKFDRRSPTQRDQPQLPMSSPMLATPPGGSDEGFGGNDGGMGGLGEM